jgi:thioredoxin reductase (NADPH)
MTGLRSAAEVESENYSRFENKGVHYAATAIEGNLCRGQEIAVVGGGNSAGQAAVFLSGLAKHVHLIIRRESLNDTMSQYLISRIMRSDRITLHTSSQVTQLCGDQYLSAVTLADLKSDDAEQLEITQLFVMIGADPNTGWLYGSVKLDSKGFVATGAPYGFNASRFATSLPGVFAVGDVRSDSVKRVASAVGEGSVAISDVHRHLASDELSLERR